MKKLIAALCLSLPLSLFSQNSIVQEGEFGFGLGAGHYFGDLNTRAKLNRPKLAAGLFFRKNFGNYIALRLAGNFAQLGYSDVYNTHNEAMRRRNLSFNTNVWELALQGDFNFYRFMPGDPDFSFTPYEIYFSPSLCCLTSVFTYTGFRPICSIRETRKAARNCVNRHYQ